MTTIDYYRLEYNEKEGLLKYEPFSKRKDNAYGWETIAMVIYLNDLLKLIETVRKTYPEVNSGCGNNFPKTSVIKNIYNDFIGISDL